MCSEFYYIDLKKEKEFERKFDRIGYGFPERVKNYFDNKIKPLFSKKKSLDKSVESNLL